MDELPIRRGPEALLSCALALSEPAGPALVLGAPPREVVLGLAASATRVTLAGAGRSGPHLEHVLDAGTPCPVTLADGIEAVEGPFRTLLVWELPGDDALGALDAALARVADGGVVWVCVVRDRARDGRLQRLLEGHCGGRIEVPPGAPGDRLLRRGLRRSPEAADVLEEVPEPLPVAAVVPSAGRLERLELLLVDLLLRQGYPPQEVYVVDLAEEEAVPGRLFGLPERAGGRTVLVRNPGAPPADALNEVLGAVGVPYVALLDERDRLAPNHLATLGLALEADEGLDAAVSAAALLEGGRPVGCLEPPRRDPENLLLPALEGAPLPVSAALFRTGALERVEGLDPRAGEAWVEDLWLRLAAGGRIGRSASVLSGLDEDRWGRLRSASHVRHVRRAAAWMVDGIPLARLALEFPDAPPERREALARRARADAHRRAGRTAAGEGPPGEAP